MTLPLNSRLSALYDTNGTQKDFSFGFRVFFDPDNGGYGLEVRRQTADGYEVIPKSDYLVLPVEDNSAGVVRFSVAPSTGQQIYIAGKTPTIQQLVLTNFGRYSAESIETQFDFITAIIQEWLSALGEETRQRIAADDILTQYVVQRIDDFVQQVNQNWDDKSQEIEDYIATIMPSFAQTLRDEIEAYAVSGMQDAIDQTLAESKAEIDDAVARATAAATAAAISAGVFETAEAGVDPVTGVADGAYFNVRSSNNESYIDEYQNVGGVATATGKSYPSYEALNAINEAIIDPDTGKAIASKVFDKTGASVQEVNDFNLGNYASLPKGLFSGQPAKFGGIQYIWDAASTATPEDNLIIQPSGVSSGRWIIHAYDGCIYSSTVNDIQKAVDYCAKNKLKFAQSSDLTLSTDLYINTFESGARNDFFQYDAQNFRLHFTSGGLHFRTSSFSAYGLRVSTDDVDAKGAIIVQPFERINGATGWPDRFTFIDSWAINSNTNGWYITNTWIGSWYSCYARYNKKWGVYLDHLNPEFPYNLSCNNLIWVGGEIQGNGKTDGTGGGVYHGKLVSAVWDTCIEGNYGDGVYLVGSNNNVTFRGYIEKNGSIPTNVDFRSPPVTSPTDRPRNIFLERTNHTAKNGGQERCMDLYDIDNLQINNPIFYGSASSMYTQEPIRVRESVSGYSRGKVINPTLLYSGYTQAPLLNECTKFGELRKQIVMAGIDFPSDADTSKYIFVTETKEHLARWNKMTFKFITIPDTSSDLQPVRLKLSGRGYPFAFQYAVKEETFTPAEANTVYSFSYEVALGSKDRLNGGLGWAVSRLGTHAEDTNTVPIQCVGAEFEYYVGVV